MGSVEYTTTMEKAIAKDPATAAFHESNTVISKEMNNGDRKAPTAEKVCR